MRTTVDIPDTMYRQLKSKAALQGRSVKELILRGVESELEGTSGKRRKTRVAFPIVASKRPGSLRLSNREINDILSP